jgi:type VI secretion system protein ImpE
VSIEKAEEHLREGDPGGALEALQEAVRKDPSNAKFRIFLFQLLSVMGNWDRALNQLNVVGELDGTALPMVQTYREALSCEVFRQRVFAGEKSPLILGEPEEWLAQLMEALRLGAEGHIEASQDLRNQAFEAAPTSPGWINGEPFEWIADADPRMGPVLEIVVHGRYYWLPFHQVREIVIDEPSDLRDMVWTAAHLVLTNEGTVVGLIPTRYPDSHSSEDGRVRLARRTEWVDKGSDLFLGFGQRILATDSDEYPILEVRSVTMQSEEEPEAASGGTEESPEPEGEGPVAEEDTAG